MAQPADVAFGFTLTAAFLVLACIGTIGWLRHGDRVHANLAWASGLLAAVCLAFRVDDITGGTVPIIGPWVVLTMLGSGYALLMLRDSLIPFSRRWKTGSRAVLAGTGAYVLLIGFPLRFEEGITPLETSAILLLSAVWGACATEPMLRFWRRSRHLPVVQRVRMRSLSIGYGGLVVILLASTLLFGSEPPGHTNQAEAGILAVSLVFVAAQIIAFAPPRWVRRIYREREERALIHAAGPHMFRSSDVDEVAAHATRWAVRLVGADRGFLLEPAHGILAVEGSTREDARALAEKLPVNGRAHLVKTAGRRSEDVIVVPIRLDTGGAVLAVVAGPFTPTFGDEEVALLAHFGETVAAALDRLRLDEIRRTFLTAISHELRTPLTSIVGVGHTLRRAEAAGLAPHRRDELLGGLVRNADRLDQLLSDLLDVDRLSRGILEARRSEVDVPALVRNVTERTDASDRHPIVLEIAEPLFAQVDGPMVERILENLVGNAAKHTPPGTSITVTAEAVGEDLLLTVSDRGPGIPEGLRDSVFEPFRRGPTAPSHAPGSGIGLSLVARFADLHRGKAWVESRSGGGARFRVSLPGSVVRVEPPASEHPSDLSLVTGRRPG